MSIFFLSIFQSEKVIKGRVHVLFWYIHFTIRIVTEHVLRFSAYITTTSNYSSSIVPIYPPHKTDVRATRATESRCVTFFDGACTTYVHLQSSPQAPSSSGEQLLIVPAVLFRCGSIYTAPSNYPLAQPASLCLHERHIHLSSFCFLSFHISKTAQYVLLKHKTDLRK